MRDNPPNKRSAAVHAQSFSRWPWFAWDYESGRAADRQALSPAEKPRTATAAGVPQGLLENNPQFQLRVCIPINSPAPEGRKKTVIAGSEKRCGSRREEAQISPAIDRKSTRLNSSHRC